MRLSVLIAEGDSDLRDAYVDFFQRIGFRVETAAGGVECLERIRDGRPDVLLIDEDLNWGGAEGVLARLVEEASLPYVPVVMATGDRAPGELSAALGLPATHCFRKPFRMHRLVDCIESAVLRFQPQVALTN